MAKKLKKSDDQLADAVRMSSQEIWQAGLAAFAKAQEEEGKFFSMQLFEERVLRALSSIGVPTRQEVDALRQRIDELTQQVAALGGQPAAKKRAAKADKPAAAKPAAKKAAAKKPAAKKAK
ncbi:polyhydroxyalkanoate synthesis regulator phasin [Duganella sp. 1224]|uniref:phasin family protein n=1 Tax=Duganella sp. 1224 TaxID=2587052 RepID=UPI0015CB2CF2|nr:phasin family protein [Duganella sp. 1224]NYE61016.1 polyhydroxyalkanoate synthesis regulator phasin [Duganella sp. 1224]